MESADYLPPLLGGTLIGLASGLLLLVSGRIAGISGIVSGLLRPAPGEAGWRAGFVAGLVGVGFMLSLAWPEAFAQSLPSLPVLAVAGLAVGFGTRLGSGCTSGHGVCGLGRFSARSLVATLTFTATGATTVFVMRHVVG